MTENTAYYITAEKLAKAGLDGVPSELKSSEHLIYSSPAALSFNSPGAQGFGVKRAALAVPGSIELLVAPGCCGRNTTILSRSGGYRDRFFYLLMDDTDIVTGRHLKKIPEAVKEAADSCDERPSCVMICITCVDALLGTDMERVCRRASEYAGLPVLPSYMYALTREGREPPMTSVRKSIYSLLEKRNLKIGKQTSEESSQPKGTIINQSPLYNSPVEEGTAVNIVLSDGKPEDIKLDVYVDLPTDVTSSVKLTISEDGEVTVDKNIIPNDYKTGYKITGVKPDEDTSSMTVVVRLDGDIYAEYKVDFDAKKVTQTVQREYVSSEPEPISSEPEPVSSEPEPISSEPEPISSEPEPVSSEEPEPDSSEESEEP